MPQTATAPTRPARLRVYQQPRNPTHRDRRILTLLAEGYSQKQAANQLRAKPRSITSALARMRDRYTAPSNEALVALAIRLQWIEIAVEIQPEPPQG
jgi:DNA-binding CsgD family transcriptional regulator